MASSEGASPEWTRFGRMHAAFARELARVGVAGIEVPGLCAGAGHGGGGFCERCVRPDKEAGVKQRGLELGAARRAATERQKRRVALSLSLDGDVAESPAERGGL